MTLREKLLLIERETEHCSLISQVAEHSLFTQVDVKDSVPVILEEVRTRDVPAFFLYILSRQLGVLSGGTTHQQRLQFWRNYEIL